MLTIDLASLFYVFCMFIIVFSIGLGVKGEEKKSDNQEEVCRGTRKRSKGSRNRKS
jgi:hypothetical protein